MNSIAFLRRFRRSPIAHSAKVALALFASSLFVSCGRHNSPTTSTANAPASETSSTATNSDAAGDNGNQPANPFKDWVGNQEFADAAKNNDLEKVKALLQANPGLVSVTNTNGGTLLHQAALNGQKDVVELLLASGADANARNNNGATPLLVLAANTWHLDVVKLLLDKGAEVNATNNKGFTPLHVAQAQSKMAMVGLLREHGGHE